MRVLVVNPFAKVWGRGFLHHLKTELDKTISHSRHELPERMFAAAQALFDSRRHRLPDRQAQAIIDMCSLVLVAYREVRSTLGNSQMALDLVRAACHKNYKIFSEGRNCPLLWFSRDPVTLLSKLNLKRWSRWMYGSSMEFEQEPTEDRVSFLVNRCAFHEFFVEQGETELTQLL